MWWESSCAVFKLDKWEHPLGSKLFLFNFLEIKQVCTTISKA